MKTFIMQYRTDGGRWHSIGRMRAACAANAIANAARLLRDVGGTIEISACEI